MLYTEMIGEVLAEAQGCPREQAARAVRNACIEWCKKTLCLTEGSQIQFDGTDVPSLDLDQVVHDIVGAWVDGKRVLVTHMNDERVEDIPDGEYDYAITYADPANPVLHPAATAEAPVTVDLMLAFGPGPTSTEVTELLWQRYSEWLTSGALYRVLEMPGKSWTNPESASYHKGRYEDAMSAEAVWQGRNRVSSAQRLRTKPA
jgi:hypothetical protein